MSRVQAPRLGHLRPPAVLPADGGAGAGHRGGRGSHPPGQSEVGLVTRDT